ncbi:hypothetical protein ACFL6S_27075 [Candidatus Poribacteria bacterium]
MKKRHKADEIGFTLVELLVVLGLVALIVIAVPASFKGGTQIWGKGDKHAEALQNGLIGMQHMVSELTQAKGLEEVGDDYIVFYSSKNENEDDYKDIMRFGKSAGDPPTYLQQESDGWDEPDVPRDLSGPIADNTGTSVDDLHFDYYLADGVTPFDPEEHEVYQIRSVLIKMNTVDSEEGNDIFLSSRVYIRDLISGTYGDSGDDDDDEFAGEGAGEFAIFGTAGAYLKNNTEVFGGGLDGGGVGSNGSVDLKNNTYVTGDVVYGTSLDADKIDPDSPHTERKLGEFEECKIPCATDFSGFTTGGDPVTESGTYAPGYYGDLDFKDGVVNLSSGVYYFDSFTITNNFTMNIELTEDPDTEELQDIRIFVRDKIIIGNKLTINPPNGGTDAAYIYFETNYTSVGEKDPAIDMQNNGEIYATFHAPNGDIGNFSNAPFDATGMYGSLYAGRYAWVHNSSPITYVRSIPLWDPLRCAGY